MPLTFEEQKELIALKNKTKLEQIKAANDSLTMEHFLKSARLDKLLEYISKGGKILNE